MERDEVFDSIAKENVREDTRETKSLADRITFILRIGVSSRSSCSNSEGPSYTH